MPRQDGDAWLVVAFAVPYTIFSEWLNTEVRVELSSIAPYAWR